MPKAALHPAALGGPPTLRGPPRGTPPEATRSASPEQACSESAWPGGTQPSGPATQPTQPSERGGGVERRRSWCWPSRWWWHVVDPGGIDRPHSAVDRAAARRMQVRRSGLGVRPGPRQVRRPRPVVGRGRTDDRAPRGRHWSLWRRRRRRERRRGCRHRFPVVVPRALGMSRLGPFGRHPDEVYGIRGAAHLSGNVRTRKR